MDILKHTWEKGEKGIDPKVFINKIKPKELKLIKGKNKPIKVKFIFLCKFMNENPATGQIDRNSGNFSNKPIIVSEATDLSELYDTITEKLLESIDKIQKQGSGWQFDEVESFSINMDPYTPISGSSYIELPEFLANKKAIINVKNENDHKCFKWAVTSAVFPREKDPQRLNKAMRENSEKFDWTGRVPR